MKLFLRNQDAAFVIDLIWFFVSRRGKRRGAGAAGTCGRRGGEKNIDILT